MWLALRQNEWQEPMTEEQIAIVVSVFMFEIVEAVFVEDFGWVFYSNVIGEA